MSRFFQFRMGLSATVALLYVLLGISAAWHAPHSSREGTSLGDDRHAQHEAVLAGDCALCTVKPASQFVSSGFAPVHASIGHAKVEISEARGGLSRPAFAGRPRAPPALS
jgi:hypothetical protein